MQINKQATEKNSQTYFCPKVARYSDMPVCLKSGITAKPLYVHYIVPCVCNSLLSIMPRDLILFKLKISKNKTCVVLFLHRFLQILHLRIVFVFLNIPWAVGVKLKSSLYVIWHWLYLKTYMKTHSIVTNKQKLEILIYCQSGVSC